MREEGGRARGERNKGEKGREREMGKKGRRVGKEE